MEKFANTAISKLSAIGLKNSATPFDSWDEKDRKEYLEYATALQKQFNLSSDDVHRLVGEFEKTGKVDINSLGIDNAEDTGDEYADNYEYIDDVFSSDLSEAEMKAILKQITSQDIPEEEKDYARSKYLEGVGVTDEGNPYAKTYRYKKSKK